MKASSDFPAEVSQNNCEADFRWTFCTDCETETLSQVWQVSFSLFHSSFPSPHPLFPFDPPSSTTCQLTPIRAAVGWCGDGGGWGLGLGPPGYCLQLASPPYLSGLASLRHGGAGNLQHQLRVHHGLLIPGHTCSLCVCVCVREIILVFGQRRDFLLQNIFVNAEGFQQRNENEVKQQVSRSAPTESVDAVW